MKSDGYYKICMDCKFEFNYITDYCPNCGGENVEDNDIIFDYGTDAKPEKSE